MNVSNVSFESELQISVRPVTVALIILDLLFILTINSLLTSAEQFREAIQGILLVLILLSAWKFESRNPIFSRWLIIIALISMIFSTSIRYSTPVFLCLMVIPVSLSAALISVPAATITTIGVTLLLVAFFYFFPSSSTTSAIITSLVSMWTTLSILHAVYTSIGNVTRWTSEYYRHAYAVYKEAQESRVALGQVLEDLVHANRQLALVNKRISDYRLIAEQALQAKSDFVAKVSHEFRTPLNIIIGLVELMVETPETYDIMPSPEMHNDLKVIYRNSEHLSNMINDVLDLTRTEVGYLTLHRERQDLHSIIESAMIAVRPLLENKKLTWQVSAPTNLPEVYCDGIRIEQVILNLVSNAARHTDKGSITVKVHQQYQRIVVSVTDTGSGIAPEDVERIFEPFLQGSAYPGRDRGGSGLGLSISKEIVELHGGRMWVESKLGVGSTFNFELPISPPLLPESKPGNQIVQELVWSDHRPRFLFPDSHYKPRLVVFDEMGELYQMLAHFSDDVEFVHARNIDRVIEAIQQSPAQAVMVNIESPEDVFKSLEKTKQGAPDTPIIVCSVPRKIEHADTPGVMGYLTKPVKRSDLMNAIQAVGKPIRRVLVVDDDPIVQDILNRMLLVYDSTLEITIVSNGKQALAELHRGLPDLMLLDMVMPEMDGWQVLRTIREDETIGDVPILVVSAQDPMGTPPTSAFLLASIEKGLSPSRLLTCSLEISTLLLKP